MGCYWRDILSDKRFLEPGYPEPVNSTSSGVFVLCALWVFVMSQERRTFTLIFYSVMCSVGLGSFGNHWNGYRVWGRLDSMSMVLTIYLGFVKFWHAFLMIVRPAFVCVDRTAFQLLYKGAFLCIMLFMTLCLSFLTVEGQPFNIPVGLVSFMAIPGVCMTSLLLTMWCIHRRHPELTHWSNTAWGWLVAGYAWCVAGTLAWALYEPLASYYPPWVGYIPVHGFWHLAMCFGPHRMIQAEIYWNKKLTEKDTTLYIKNTHPHIILRLQYRLFPLCHWEQQPYRLPV